MTTLFAFVLVFCTTGIALITIARFRLSNALFKNVAYMVASILVVFAIGTAALDLFGLSGCGKHIEAGLTWDWPW